MRNSTEVAIKKSMDPLNGMSNIRNASGDYHRHGDYLNDKTRYEFAEDQFQPGDGGHHKLFYGPYFFLADYDGRCDDGGSGEQNDYYHSGDEKVLGVQVGVEPRPAGFSRGWHYEMRSGGLEELSLHLVDPLVHNVD